MAKKKRVTDRVYKDEKSMAGFEDNLGNYKKVALEARLKVLELIYSAQVSHIGSVLGSADIMTVLFKKIDFDKDVFVAGKSWIASLLYYFLWKRGRISEEELNSYCKDGSKFIGLVEPITKDIPFGIGSMGTGFPAAVGFALAKKLKGEDGTVFCFMSDGELNCGTTWESSLIAAHHKLDNLVVLVEENGYQAMGKTKDILDSYFPARDWRYTSVDGHDHGAIEARLDGKFFNGEGSPRVIFAKTIKGKGVSFMENENSWHYRQVDKESYELAQQELRQS